jgi:hypothetical protein
MSRLDLALEHLLKAVMAPCDEPDDCSSPEALLATGEGAIHEQLSQALASDCISQQSAGQSENHLQRHFQCL